MGLIGDFISIHKSKKMLRDTVGEENYKEAWKQVRREAFEEFIEDKKEERRNLVKKKCCYTCAYCYFPDEEDGYCTYYHNHMYNLKSENCCDNWEIKLRDI